MQIEGARETTDSDGRGAANLVGSEGSRDGDGGGRDCLKALWRALQFLQIFISWPPLPPRPCTAAAPSDPACLAAGRWRRENGTWEGEGHFS